MTITSRYLSKLHQLNSAMLVPDQFVMSPEAFHELQKETTIHIGENYYSELLDQSSGLKNSLFGIKVVIDPDLRGDEVFLEIAI